MGTVRRTAVAVALTTTLAGCWGAPGAGPDRTGHNTAESRIGLQNVATLAPAWATAVGSRPSDPVTTADGVFVTTSDGTAATVHALDADDGAPRWEATLYDNTIAPPTEWSGAYVQGGQIIAGWSYFQYLPAMNEAGTVRFDPVTGERSDGEGGPVSAVRGDRSAHVMVQNWQMYAVTELTVADADDPATSWSGIVGSSVTPGAVIGDDGTVFVTGSGPASPTPTTGAALVGGLRAYAPTGTNGCVGLFPRGWDPTPVQPIDLRCPAWVAPLSGRLSAPVMSRATGELLVASDDGSVHGVDRATGALHWSAAIGANGTTPALDTRAGLVHVPLAAGGTATLRLADCAAGSCAPAWTTGGSGGVVRTQPAIAGGVVFTGSDSGALAAYPAAGCGAATCAPVWSTTTGSPVVGAPAVSNGRLVVAVADGRALAYAPAG